MKAVHFQLSYLFIVLLLLGLSACEMDAPSDLSPSDAYYSLEIPQGFPKPIIPDDNKMTKLRVELGKKLFFDSSLSSDGKVSCGSCHFQQIAFSDFDRLSKGVEGRIGMRNAPGLTNVAYGESFFRDGGVPSLELQVLVPFDDVNEMNLPIKEVIDRLNEDAEYPEMFWNAYQREPDPFSLIRAIAAFERTLISGNSRYDQYEFQGQKDALNASELSGKRLFFSEKTKCAQCHSGFNFTDESFRNNGIYELYSDSGRTRVTANRGEYARFKVPTLRNIALTGPYMHDGSFQTMEDVIDHYASGGKNHFNQSELVAGFELSAEERIDLVNFLKSLTDQSFITNPAFMP